MIARARDLRNNATEEERWLWYRLRQLRKDGYHFRRQSPFGRYVLDFVCHDERVVVELDGSQHGKPENERSDNARDNFLLSHGYRTVRIPNWWVKDDPDWVGHFIRKRLSGGESATPTPTPPHKGEGERKPRVKRPNKGRPQPKTPTPTLALSVATTSPSPLRGGVGVGVTALQRASPTKATANDPYTEGGSNRCRRHPRARRLRRRRRLDARRPSADEG